MKLLFTQGQYELRSVLGFLDADIEVDEMKSELYQAATDLIDLVGQEAYDYALGLYAKQDRSDDEEFMLFHFRYPVALDAYRHYAPSGDISHTNNGRKMRNDEHEKAAFEWMLNKNDENLEKKFYKSLDKLLELLDNKNPSLSLAPAEVKWKATDAFKKTHRLFVRSTKDFDQSFPIDSRLLLIKLQPGLHQCERRQILPRIGQEKFDLLKNILNGTDADSELDQDLLDLIQEACVFSALAWGLRRLRVSLLPEGVLQRYSGDRSNTKSSLPPAKMEAELAAQSFEADAEKVLKQIESYTSPPPTAEELKDQDVFPQDFNPCEDDNFLTT